jgi:hypothetical protein
VRVFAVTVAVLVLVAVRDFGAIQAPSPAYPKKRGHADPGDAVLSEDEDENEDGYDDGDGARKFRDSP